MSRWYYIREPAWMPPYRVLMRSLILVSAKLAIWWAFRNVLGRRFIYIHAASWLVWIVIGGIPTAGVAMESMRNLWRYGLCGLGRPRWWFETARLAEAIYVFSFLSLPLFLFAPAGLFPVVLEVATAVTQFSGAAYVSCLAIFTVGFVLSLARRLPRSGRAFECVYWLYLFAPSYLMYRIGAELWPPRAVWPDAVMFWTIAALGVCCFVAAAVSVGKQRSRYEKSQRKQRKAARKAQAR